MAHTEDAELAEQLASPEAQQAAQELMRLSFGTTSALRCSAFLCVSKPCFLFQNYLFETRVCSCSFCCNMGICCFGAGAPFSKHFGF